jgi:hypothetical protein
MKEIHMFEAELTSREEAAGTLRNFTRDISSSERWAKFEDYRSLHDAIAKQHADGRFCTFGATTLRVAAMVCWWRTRSRLRDL